MYERDAGPGHSSNVRDRPRFDSDDGFRRELERRVDAHFETTGASMHGGWRMLAKAGLIFAWFAASWLLLVLVADAWWQGVLLAGSLALSIAAIGFCVQHDANHGAFSRFPTINRLMERSLDFLGASSYLWRWKHNVFHHSYTNLTGADHDIDLGPFARMAPTQPRRPMHRYQHWYMWAAYGLIAYNMHFLEDFKQLILGRVGHTKIPRPRGHRLVELFFSKLVLLSWSVVIPMLFHRWWVVLLFYFAVWFTVGVLLGVVFQVAHLVEEADFPAPEPGTDQIASGWAAHQVETTVDFGHRSRLLTWYVGGLNYQIEHHLFPKICHLHHPRIAPIVREVCAEYGVRYTVNDTLIGAVRSHTRWLRRMGTPVAA
jgi:linoleoyl-CoA desaturase